MENFNNLDHQPQLTFSVFVTCLVAASSGLIFGYDIGISGGVSTMSAFLEKFYPEVMKHRKNPQQNVYCVYNSDSLASFTSSLYIAGFVSSFIAGKVTSKMGRRFSMLVGGFTFFLGGVLDGLAENVSTLIAGRLLFGFGIGFSNQSTPLYLSEVAPPKWRGAFNTGFHLFIGIGNVVATLVNYYTSPYEWGWRVSLGFAMVPAFIMTTGVLFIPDSPTSLVERGKIVEAREALQRLRGEKANVDPEMTELIKAADEAQSISQESFLTIFRRQYRPQLVMAVAVPFFQMASGIFIIAFYGPAILQSVGGSGSNAALEAAIILGMVNIASILISTYTVDRCGRRKLFMSGGFAMLVAQIGMGISLALTVGESGEGKISKFTAITMLLLMCVFAVGFGISWGPLVWVIQGEVFPMRVRPIGNSVSVAVNLATTFLLTQTFLQTLCVFKFGAFLFYACWIAVMTLFVVLFLPETKGVPLDCMMTSVWGKHWFWRRYTTPLNDALRF